MKYRKLDANNDYTFGQQNEFYEATEAVSQAVFTSLKLLYGEWWEDTTSGLPLFEQILGKSGTPEDLQSADLVVRECISQVQGVTGIGNFTSSYKNRSYSISCTVQTQYGDATVEMTF